MKLCLFHLQCYAIIHTPGSGVAPQSTRCFLANKALCSGQSSFEIASNRQVLMHCKVAILTFTGYFYHYYTWMWSLAGIRVACRFGSALEWFFLWFNSVLPHLISNRFPLALGDTPCRLTPFRETFWCLTSKINNNSHYYNGELIY